MSVFLLRQRLEREPLSVLTKRAEVWIERLPEGPRKERFKAELKALEALPPEERLRRMVVFLLVLAVAGAMVLSIGFFILTPKPLSLSL
jgi:hypothetical protein